MNAHKEDSERTPEPLAATKSGNGSVAALHVSEIPQLESDLPPGLGNPARRALAGAGLWRLEHVARLSEREFMKLHGIGPHALRLLRQALSDAGLSFADQHKG